jgi:hypothetical protein
MKRLISAFVFVFAVTSASYAQYVITPSGLEKTEVDGNDYIIIEAPNCSSADLYKKTLQFIAQTYVSPKDVISSQIENETIAITALQTIFYDFNVNYKLLFRFKNGRVRFDMPQILSMKKFQDGREMHLTFTKTESATSSVWIFNNKGELRGMAIPAYKNDLENLFNSIFNNYKSFLTAEESQEDDNW